MGKQISGLIVGLIFGLGLTISQMVNPEKVLGFLDILGNWDPSLAFVMGAALLITAIGYRLVWTRRKPVFEDAFQLPGNKKIDPKLAIGAVLFGIGWGLVGLCPGPALASITIGGLPAWQFVGAMIAGVIVYDLIVAKRIA
ncbi:MAG: hypothetical protein CMK09_13205 [Ponticaulis sp.]|nr:hypothetical protein [Ponticaulis sp.]|tara:strand:- start:1431 stop:1853 length:423 start_codon:yes stop_codon:yes gene_type:complete